MHECVQYPIQKRFLTLGRFKCSEKKNLCAIDCVQETLRVCLEVAEYIPCVCRFEQQEMQRCSFVR